MFAHLVQKARTPEGLCEIVAIRHRARLQQLPETDRVAWIEKQVRRLLRLPIHERAQHLFHEYEKDGPWFVDWILNEPGQRIGWFSRVPYVEPELILKGVDGYTRTLPIATPLPMLQLELAAFVREQRRLTGLTLPRGRKPGSPLIAANPFSSAYLAYLYRRRGLRKRELLELCGKLTTADGYRWLDRRLQIGSQLLQTFSSEELATLDGFSLDAMKRLPPLALSVEGEVAPHRRST